MIKIICFGKIKENYLKDGINDYLKRMSKYHKIEIIELKDDNDIKKEENDLLKYMDLKARNIVLDIQGSSISSEGLATVIDKSFNEKGTINFIVGSSNGLSDAIKQKADLKISFGHMTMPHGLFRLVLVEQIYRAFKINNNESYHK